MKFSNIKKATQEAVLIESARVSSEDSSPDMFLFDWETFPLIAAMHERERLAEVEQIRLTNPRRYKRILAKQEKTRRERAKEKRVEVTVE